MEWNNLNINKISRLELVCPNCNKVNVKVKGEDLNCDFCGAELFVFFKEDKNE